MVSLNATAPFFCSRPPEADKNQPPFLQRKRADFAASFRYIDCYNISERIPYRFRLDFYAEIENTSVHLPKWYVK